MLDVQLRRRLAVILLAALFAVAALLALRVFVTVGTVAAAPVAASPLPAPQSVGCFHAGQISGVNVMQRTGQLQALLDRDAVMLRYSGLAEVIDVNVVVTSYPGDDLADFRTESRAYSAQDAPDGEYFTTIPIPKPEWERYDVTVEVSYSEQTGAYNGTRFSIPASRCALGLVP